MSTLTDAVTVTPQMVRLARWANASVSEMRLNLNGRVVLTEAATGAYVVTPVLAAIAGADRVIAFTRETRYGSVDDVVRQTYQMADLMGVADRIEVVVELDEDTLGCVDLVTNSGHLRPLDERILSKLKSGAAISLMYEAWELGTRPSDVDLRAVRDLGLRIAGTNERHPAVDVLSYLAPMVTASLAGAGIAVYRSSVGVLCDNDFQPYVVDGLRRCGADVRFGSTLDDLAGRPLDAVVVALRPGNDDVLGHDEAASLAAAHPGAVLVQLWGDIDRAAFAGAGFEIVPPAEPPRGHMGILPSAVGPEAVVRLQAGGLKVAQVLLEDAPSTEELAYVDGL